MIKAVVIPPATDRPLYCVTIDPKEISFYEGAADNNRQTYELRNPIMTLYSNSASKTPLNIRATLILWVHNRTMTYRSMIFGQALLTGNSEGVDTDVPEEIIELIFKDYYKIEKDDSMGDGIRYEELPYVYAAALNWTAPSIESEVSVAAVLIAKVRAWCNS